MAEAAQRSKQRLCAWIAEAQRRDALTGRRYGWHLQMFEKSRRGYRSVGDALGIQQFGIDLPSDRSQVGQGVQAFRSLKVERVVDGGLGAWRAVLFEVLLDVGVFELHVQAGR